MTTIMKLENKLLSKPKDFRWAELKTLLQSYGYQEFNAGKTIGSRIRFVHNKYNDIMLHKPHPNPELKGYQLKQLIEQLKKEELL